MTYNVEDLETLIRKFPKEYRKQEGTIIDCQKNPEIPGSILYGFEITARYSENDEEKIFRLDITDIESNNFIETKTIKHIQDLIGKKTTVYSRNVGAFDDEDIYITLKHDIHF